MMSLSQPVQGNGCSSNPAVFVQSSHCVPTDPLDVRFRDKTMKNGRIMGLSWRILNINDMNGILWDMDMKGAL